MTRDELLTELERQAAEAEAMQASAPVATVLRTLVPKVRELDGVARTSQDHMITVEEAAERLAVTPRWIYDRLDSLPFVHQLADHTLRVSDHGLTRWLERNKTTSTKNGRR